MTDTLASRVGRIVAGSAHAVVEAIEGAMPDAVLQQSIREIDKAIDDVRTELGRAIAEKHLAGKRLAEQSSRHDELMGHVEMALREGRDDLARAAVERQLDVEAQVPVLEATLAEAGRRQVELEGYVAALSAKRREMQDAFTAMRKARAQAAEQAGTDDGTRDGPNPARRVDGATRTFDRMMLREGAPGTGDVDRDLDGRVAALDRLARDHRIEERLAAIKARSGETG